MTDPKTHKRVEIGRGSRGGGMFWFLRDRMEQVRAVLDQHAVPYWREAISVSSDGGPYISSISLRVKADVDLAQRLLDSLP